MSAIHGKARGESSIGPDDDCVLPRATVPILHASAHELLHLGESRRRVGHLVPRLLLRDQPVDQVIDLMPVLFGDVGRVVIEVFEVFTAGREGAHPACKLETLRESASRAF